MLPLRTLEIVVSCGLALGAPAVRAQRLGAEPAGAATGLLLATYAASPLLFAGLCLLSVVALGLLLGFGLDWLLSRWGLDLSVTDPDHD